MGGRSRAQAGLPPPRSFPPPSRAAAGPGVGVKAGPALQEASVWRVPLPLFPFPSPLELGLGAGAHWCCVQRTAGRQEWPIK